MNRRAFLLTATTAATAARLPAKVRAQKAQSPYFVGVAANQSDPYAATQRAIASLPAGQFPDVGGRPVVIKVNLVTNRSASTGTTTDPAVARALVDLCLANGATQVAIVEAGQISKGGISDPPPWSDCGYTSMFAGYSTVSLVDLDTDPRGPAPVPNSFVYSRIYLPQTLVAGDPVFISAAKLKTHIWSGVTLSTKNLFGLWFEIIAHSETIPTSVTVVKTLSDWAQYTKNTTVSQVWDGTDDSGAPVPPGLRHLVRISARSSAAVTKVLQFNYAASPLAVYP